MPLNEEDIFENIFLLVVNMNNGTKKVVTHENFRKYNSKT